MSKFVKNIDTFGMRSIYDDTERSGSKVNLFDLKVIATRFFFSSQYVANKRVVEFGAGSVLGKSEILSACANYTAVEIHPNTAHELQIALGTQYTVLNEDCCATSLPDNCCDVIIAFAMIYYTNFEDLISEAVRLLTPNGKIIFCSPNPNQPNFKKAPSSIEYLKPNEVESICARYGIITKTFGAYPYQMPKNNLTEKVKRYTRGQLKAILRVVQKISPTIYLYLRSLERGKVGQIPKEISSIKDFEIPVKYDTKLSGCYKMYYYEGTKQ
jgi:SAM-dependent methyltransferase